MPEIEGPLAAPDATKYVVYGICEGDQETDPFYIGITNDMSRRAAQHNNPDSSAFPMSKWIEGHGSDCLMYPIRYFDNLAQAIRYEAIMIALRPQMFNKIKPTCDFT